MKVITFLVITFIIFSCAQERSKEETNTHLRDDVSLIILGNVQDGGSPHIGCDKVCCSTLFNTPDKTRKVVSLGVIDAEHQKSYIFDATPDFPQQMKLLKNHCWWSSTKEEPDGIFLTHAHIGHYTGLMYLGKEARGSTQIPVYAMPKMKEFLELNGPWSQLVSMQNIVIREMKNEQVINLTPNLKVMPLLVPHRDEYSETVGYKIEGPNKSCLFIPDIDKWMLWNRNIIDEIAQVDYAFVDATFYDGNEIGRRDISEIPHPFVIESMDLFKDLSSFEKKKVHFIHMNHTNPLLNTDSEQNKEVIKRGFKVARFNDIFTL